MSVKGTVRTYHNARGEGKVFSFDLVDSAGGEIKVTAFTDACDKFYELIQKGKVYMVSKASLKPKRPVSFCSVSHALQMFCQVLAWASNVNSMQNCATALSRIGLSTCDATEVCKCKNMLASA